MDTKVIKIKTNRDDIDYSIDVSEFDVIIEESFKFARIRISNNKNSFDLRDVFNEIINRVKSGNIQVTGCVLEIDGNELYTFKTVDLTYLYDKSKIELVDIVAVDASESVYVNIRS